MEMEFPLLRSSLAHLTQAQDRDTPLGHCSARTEECNAPPGIGMMMKDSLLSLRVETNVIISVWKNCRKENIWPTYLWRNSRETMTPGTDEGGSGVSQWCFLKETPWVAATWTHKAQLGHRRQTTLWTTIPSYNVPKTGKNLRKKGINLIFIRRNSVLLLCKLQFTWERRVYLQHLWWPSSHR